MGAAELTIHESSVAGPEFADCLAAHQPGVKRVFDIVVSTFVIVAFTPLLLGIAIAIKLDSRGPLLFCQPRIGLNARIFRCYKFRSMFHDSQDLMAAKQTTEGDPRITAVGRWLRRFSLDELPQLFNVIKGDMSLVGPRPHAPLTKAAGKLFADVVPGYHRRHAIRPGITGLAQISGCRGPTDYTDQIMRRVQFDLAYIENASLALDMRILWSTLTREIFSGCAF